MDLKTALKHIVLYLIDLWLRFEVFLLRNICPNYLIGILRKIYRLDAENAGLVQINNPEFYFLTAHKGFLGMAEAYGKKWINIPNLRPVLENIILNKELLHDPIFKYKSFVDYLMYDLFYIFDPAEDHYSLGNTLFETILDSHMNYSCALWLSPNDDLESAQNNKMELLAQKLILSPGMNVLEVGCGWGGMAKYLAQNYGVNVVGMTNNVEGAEYAKKLCKGLTVDILLGDCRDLIKKEKHFDRILAIEVLEHVGKKNYRGFFSNLQKCLKDDGLLVVHTGGSNDPFLPSTNSLPGKVLNGVRPPYIKDIIEATEGTFIIEDWSNIGANYEQTALAYLDKFKKNWKLWADVKGEEWCRIFELFIIMNSVLSHYRQVQVWEIVFSKNGIIGGYCYGNPGKGRFSRP